MMNRVQSFILNRINKIHLIILFALTLIFLIVMNVVIFPQITDSTNGINVFDLQWFTGYRYDTALAFLSTISDRGRTIYLHDQLPLDFVFAVVYASFLFLASVKMQNKLNAFTALPLLIMLIDFSENTGIYLMLTQTEVSSTLVALSSAMTICKSILIVLVVLFGLLFRKKAQVTEN